MYGQQVFYVLNFLLITNLYMCVELDFCELVQLGSENGDRRIDRNMVFQIKAFKQLFHLNVVPDSSFLAPDVAYEKHILSKVSSLRSCFYSGDVNSDPSSSAALSVCGGVRGAFSYNGMEYDFQVRGNETGDGFPSSAGKTHVIRRRFPRNVTSRCGVTSGLNQGAAEPPQMPERVKAHAEIRKKTALKGTNRSKRFVSLSRYVEVLIVADESMAKFHGDDLRHYLLTLMAVVAKLYRHPSIMNLINIVVVDMLVIYEPEEGPKISSNAAVTLRNFCTWQRRLNKVNDKHPEYWDTAILFTKQDLCGATTCDTLGMADVGTMCDPKRSCSVIEDDGLPSAFTTAHELGHVLNMPHDNVKACEMFGKLKDNHMMSPTLIQIDHNSPWSSCSAAIVTNFLDAGHGDCLLDKPQKLLALPDDPPGIAYSLSRQCELAFGSGSKPCPYMQACSKLWCTGKARGQLVCQTRHFPWADGTSCGNSRICYGGACSNRNTTIKPMVDGQWAKWGAYGSCSRTCGGGVQLAKRECSSPVPENGGKYCQGLRVKYRSCNLEPCKYSGKSFREEQCESFNNFSLNTNRLRPSVMWVPKYSGVSPKDRCKLICRASGTGYFYVLAPKVVDGTLCSPDTSAVCVQGKCIKAGCDGKLGSSVKFDKCGVCGGNNQNCHKVSGVFTKPVHGYNFVITLPVGASNIDIRQRGYRGLANDDNYLAIKNIHGQYLLNGNYVVSTVGRHIIVNNTTLRYSGTSTAVEKVQAMRPLQEPLTVEVLSVGKMTPPRVRYSYYLTNNKEEKILKKEERKHVQNSILVDTNKVQLKKLAYQKPSSKWVTSDWEECSVSCGNGFQKRRVQCLDSNGKATAFCDSTQRPSSQKVCGGPCPMWSIGEWSACSKSCGKGFKKRPLHCVTQTGLLLPRDRCSSKKKPHELDFCTVQTC
ncbi:A disintegrin and metalloproteinase with thrombospondin motifs 15 [Ictalurus punctatus]|uniref:A disintegrin and metalloproteinase with thrombospondin motifs 15 n=1 Tax=Ictalurus punctatus TaxID=7998 RepID=A0A2D0STQ2_ICTPU|nr:A disintegrin and metalloproteinase with thrombospondin motifs 15 [Ictalurus punctatus]